MKFKIINYSTYLVLFASAMELTAGNPMDLFQRGKKRQSEESVLVKSALSENNLPLSLVAENESYQSEASEGNPSPEELKLNQLDSNLSEIQTSESACH